MPVERRVQVPSAAARRAVRIRLADGPSGALGDGVADALRGCRGGGLSLAADGPHGREPERFPVDASGQALQDGELEPSQGPMPCAVLGNDDGEVLLRKRLAGIGDGEGPRVDPRVADDRRRGLAPGVRGSATLGPPEADWARASDGVRWLVPGSDVELRLVTGSGSRRGRSGGADPRRTLGCSSARLPSSR